VAFCSCQHFHALQHTTARVTTTLEVPNPSTDIYTVELAVLNDTYGTSGRAFEVQPIRRESQHTSDNTATSTATSGTKTHKVNTGYHAEKCLLAKEQSVAPIVMSKTIGEGGRFSTLCARLLACQSIWRDSRYTERNQTGTVVAADSSMSWPHRMQCEGRKHTTQTHQSAQPPRLFRFRTALYNHKRGMAYGIISLVTPSTVDVYR